MVVRRALVVMLSLFVVALMFGCGGQKAAEPTEPVDVEPPAVEEPVEEPSGEEMVEPEEVRAPELNDVFFAFDKYNLTQESKDLLEGNAGELKRASDARIVIEGHCDERGTRSYNLALGEKRANAAKDYLVALGVGASRITVISYGKERPFASGHNEAAWAKNRRAHFVIQK